MNEEIRYQQIQDYLEGRLDEAAETAFEAEMDRDPELKAEVDLQRLSGDAIELIIADSLRNDLQALQEETKQQTPPTTKVRPLRRRILPLSIAATVLLVIGFFAATYTASQYDNDVIAGAYYDNELLQRVRGNNSASLLQEGMDFYESGNYEQAIEYLDGVTNPALEAEATYAAAHAHYNLKQYPAAMDNFATVMDRSDPRFTEKAEFYYLLSALAADQAETETFNTILDKILNNEAHLHHNDVLQINKKLKSFWRNF
jgi:tetratricopeptide (TPR) repeat protein